MILCQNVISNFLQESIKLYKFSKVFSSIFCVYLPITYVRVVSELLHIFYKQFAYSSNYTDILFSSQIFYCAYNLKNAILTDSANGTLLFNTYKHVPNSELDGLYSVDIYDENSWLELVVTPEAKDTIKVIEKLKTDLNAENADFSDEQ